MEIAKNGQDKKQATKDPNAITVFETGDTRTIDFILKDGTRQNFAYAHYMTAWIGMSKEDKKNEQYINIFFSTHLVTINGYCLQIIYDELLKLSIKVIKANDIRYLKSVSEFKPYITNIKINWKSKEE